MPSRRTRLLCGCQVPQISIRTVHHPLHPSHLAIYPIRRFIFKNIILPLSRAWSRQDIQNTIKDHLVVLKPEVCHHHLMSSSCSETHAQAFPSLYNWVSYPITLLIKSIYEHEIRNLRMNEVATMPCHMRIELLASLERLLCFCHTGNTAVFATSLMHPLGLSKGALKDGFPMLLPLFEQRMIPLAMDHGFNIDPRKWPLKDGYPAIASKRAQVLTYSIKHFLVSSTSFIVTSTVRHMVYLSFSKCAAHTDYPVCAASIGHEMCRAYRLSDMRGTYRSRNVPRILTICYARHLSFSKCAAHIDYPLCAAHFENDRCL